MLVTNLSLAEKASMTCFLNSLLREWFHWSFETLPLALRQSADKGIRIPLRGEVIWIPVDYYSSLGRHRYSGTIYRQKGDETTSLSFRILVGSLLEGIDMPLESSPRAREHFKSRVFDSLNAMEELMEHRAADFAIDSAAPQTFVEAEQHLIVGHSFHPSPKSREGFTKSDRFRYGPEYKGRFPLAWLAVHQDICRNVASESFQGRDWIAELVKSDSTLGPLIDKIPGPSFTLYPMNPWQAHYLLQLPQIRSYVEEGLIVELGEYGASWYPTSSVRSICRPDAAFMLKTSLSVRLTNSLRNLMVKEVKRGIQAHDVFESTHGKAFRKAYPSFQLIAEPAYISMIDSQGEEIEESIVICRENPFAGGNAPEGLVLASLTQDDPFGGPTVIEKFVRNHASRCHQSVRLSSLLWFEKYLDHVVEPLLMAGANYGILLGAHQQNILVTFDNDLPSGSFFRDCQGTGYSEFAYERLKDEVPSLDLSNGNILPGEMSNVLFIYYLFINASFNVIHSLALSGQVNESELIEILRVRLVDLLSTEPVDPSCIKHLLTSPKIMHKGNFVCSMADMNENTSVDPLSIYTAIHNPLSQDQLSEVLTSLEKAFTSSADLQNLEYPTHKPQATQLKELGILNDDGIIEKSKFFQNPWLWHRNKTGERTLEVLTKTGEVIHPLRPSVADGIIYRRYIPTIGKHISFEVLDLEKHLDVFHQWHNQRRVYKFWELNKSKEELKEYIDKVNADPHHFPAIVAVDGVPSGYYEIYWAAEDRLGPYYPCQPYDRALHFLIGNAKHLGRDYFHSFVESISHFLFLDDSRTETLLAEPRSDNVSLLHYLQEFPYWEKRYEFDFPHKRSALLACRRDDFFKKASFL